MRWAPSCWLLAGLPARKSLRRSSHFDPWRQSVQIAALVWGAGWFLFAETAAVWLRWGLLPALSGLWAVQGAALMWIASRAPFDAGRRCRCRHAGQSLLSLRRSR